MPGGNTLKRVDDVKPDSSDSLRAWYSRAFQTHGVRAKGGDKIRDANLKSEI
jgi:hypothetical protein